mgnify:FL=1
MRISSDYIVENRPETGRFISTLTQPIKQFLATLNDQNQTLNFKMKGNVLHLDPGSRVRHKIISDPKFCITRKLVLEMVIFTSFVIETIMKTVILQIFSIMFTKSFDTLGILQGTVRGRSRFVEEVLHAAIKVLRMICWHSTKQRIYKKVNFQSFLIENVLEGNTYFS